MTLCTNMLFCRGHNWWDK